MNISGIYFPIHQDNVILVLLPQKLPCCYTVMSLALSAWFKCPYVAECYCFIFTVCLIRVQEVKMDKKCFGNVCLFLLLYKIKSLEVRRKTRLNLHRC